MSQDLRTPTEPAGPVSSAPTARNDRPPEVAGTARARRSPAAVPEMRWAAAALLAFLVGLTAQLSGGPAWLFWAAYLVCCLTGGWEPALDGLRTLRRGALDVDLLMIVAAIGAASIGQIMDSALLIVIFATSGALEAYATARTEDSVRGLLDLAPQQAVRLAPDGTEETVDTADLRVGETVLVRPGERIGADGAVLDGTSEVDQSSVTGEPLAVPKKPGAEVFAGTVNGGGALRVRVGSEPSETVIARIVALVDEAGRTKAPAQLFIEKIEQRYSVGVVVATLAVFAVPLLLGDTFDSALLRAMTFMIVASPCAVVLATMPPLLSAIANAGRHGVLVKSAVAMQRLGEVDTVVLDKTGTLTEGLPHVADIRPVSQDSTVERVLRSAASVEHLSEHPLGRAIVEAALRRSLTLAQVAEFDATPGRGVRGTVEGHVVEVVTPSGLPTAATPDDPATRAVHDLEAAGHTAVAVLVDGDVVGIIGLGDRIKPDSAGAVRSLHRHTGGSSTLLTGDNDRAARRVGEEVGVTDVRAQLLPQDKAAVVARARERGERVLAIGDGVNDAPALAAAHGSVAMGRSGADVTVDTADVVTVRDELSAVANTVGLARRARRVVTQNLVIAAVFIGVLVVWDLAGHLPMPLGVAGHEGSTVLVGLNGLRLLRAKAWRADAS